MDNTYWTVLKKVIQPFLKNELARDRRLSVEEFKKSGLPSCLPYPSCTIGKGSGKSIWKKLAK